jgi:hypothetical protein
MDSPDPYENFPPVSDLDFDSPEFRERFELEFSSPDSWLDPWPAASCPVPTKRRFRLSEAQLSVIRTWIKRTGKVYLTRSDADLLAAQTQLSRKQIRVFFTNFRIRKGYLRRSLHRTGNDSQPIVPS